MSMLHTVNYNIEVIKEEVRHLVRKGALGRQQPIYTLCQFIPAREWEFIEFELERNGYLLRDHIIDLLQPESWEND